MSRPGTRRWPAALAPILALAAAATAGCRTTSPPDGRPRVLATTTIVGDVARAVGGDRIELDVLLAPGEDPHGFVPTPRDAAAAAEADLVLASGLGLEEFLARLLPPEAGGRVVELSEGLATRTGEGGAVDPHVWMDPTMVSRWATRVAEALATVDGARAGDYAAAAEDYGRRMSALDEWVRRRLDTVPTGRRVLVTDHDELGYFCARYGCTVVGTIVPGVSTAAEPSAAELASLQDVIRRTGAPAIFVGSPVAPRRAERLAADTGARLVTLYAGSLGPPGGPADTYEELIRFDVEAIVEALGGAPAGTGGAPAAEGTSGAALAGAPSAGSVGSDPGTAPAAGTPAVTPVTAAATPEGA